jgi:hypothetical protein
VGLSVYYAFVARKQLGKDDPAATKNFWIRFLYGPCCTKGIYYIGLTIMMINKIPILLLFIMKFNPHFEQIVYGIKCLLYMPTHFYATQQPCKPG